MTAEGTSCILTAPGGAVTLELWGTDGHENLNGKHVKDFASTRRTYLLPGDAIFTFNLAKKLPTDAGPTIQTISIHDADQSHRINLHTNSIESSSFSARVGEASEADGETARVWDTGAGVYMENIYTESRPGQRPASPPAGHPARPHLRAVPAQPRRRLFRRYPPRSHLMAEGEKGGKWKIDGRAVGRKPVASAQDTPCPPADDPAAGRARLSRECRRGDGLRRVR